MFSHLVGLCSCKSLVFVSWRKSMRQGYKYSHYRRQLRAYHCLMCDKNNYLFFCHTVDTVSAVTNDLLALSRCNKGNFRTHPLLCSVLFQCSHKNINEGKI